MTGSIFTRWEDLRGIRGGNVRHRRAVKEWMKTHPAILYWGDSWFSTPLYPNLARQSAARIDGLRMIVGKPGATTEDLLESRKIDTMAGRIRGNAFDVLCISMGGNDALSKRLEVPFDPWIKGRPARIDADEAFDILAESGAFSRILDRYRQLLNALRRDVLVSNPDFRVVGQSYAPLCRIGVAGDLTIDNIGLLALLKGDVGPWLWGPMRRVLTSIEEGARFSGLMLVKGFRDSVLGPLRAEHADIFSYANLASIGSLADPELWYDEIHPKESGFSACAPVLNDALRAALPAEKRAAIH